jgi:hypothetical protein
MSHPTGEPSSYFESKCGSKGAHVSCTFIKKYMIHVNNFLLQNHGYEELHFELFEPLALQSSSRTKACPAMGSRLATKAAGPMPQDRGKSAFLLFLMATDRIVIDQLDIRTLRPANQGFLDAHTNPVWTPLEGRDHGRNAPPRKFQSRSSRQIEWTVTSVLRSKWHRTREQRGCKTTRSRRHGRPLRPAFS